METLVIVSVIFFSVLIAFMMVMDATVIGKLRKEVIDLQNENTRLKEDLKKIRDDFHYEMLFVGEIQKWNEKFRNELELVYLGRNHWMNVTKWMHDEVVKSIYSEDEWEKNLSNDQRRKNAFHKYMSQL